MGGRVGEVERGPGWSWLYYGSDELVISPLSVEGWRRGTAERAEYELSLDRIGGMARNMRPERRRGEKGT
jgi:hypothetical protein